MLGGWSFLLLVSFFCLVAPKKTKDEDFPSPVPFKAAVIQRVMVVLLGMRNVRVYIFMNLHTLFSSQCEMPRNHC